MKPIVWITSKCRRGRTPRILGQNLAVDLFPRHARRAAEGPPVLDGFPSALRPHFLSAKALRVT